MNNNVLREYILRIIEQEKIIKTPYAFDKIEVEKPVRKRKKFPLEGFIEFPGDIKIHVENDKG